MTTEMSRREQLRPYYDASLEEAERRALRHPIETMRFPDNTVSFLGALTADPEVVIIAEYKRRSPREGDIRPDGTVTEVVKQYEQGGAKALSILTQFEYFRGALEDLTVAREASSLPILRKDFVVNTYQLHEARAYGAHAVLLIVGGLSDTELKRLHEEAEEIGLECLVEVHDEDELERALEIEPAMIGVNNRDLTTLEVDLDVAHNLIPQVPEEIATVAASGYKLRDGDGNMNHGLTDELREIGADGALIGASLMREADPAEALADWLAAGSG